MIARTWRGAVRTADGGAYETAVRRDDRCLVERDLTRTQRQIVRRTG